MDLFAIQTRNRALVGSAVSKKIRRAGLIPANVYGHGITGNAHVACDPRAVQKALSSAYGRNQLIELEVNGGKHLAVCREVAIHPVTRRLRHVDFYCVTAETVLQWTLPIVLEGRSAGQKAGGRLDVAARYVKISAAPKHLPAAITVNLEPFENGQQLGVEGLPYPEGVKPIFKRAFKVFELVAVKIVKAEVVDPKAAKKGAKK